MFSSKILFLVLPRSQEATHTWPAYLAVFWCDFRLWYVKHKIRPRKSWTEVTRMKRGERGPEKEGRKTTSPLATTSSPPPSPPWPRFSFRTVYFLPYETQAKNTPEKNRLRRLTHTTNLIRVRVGFLWVWLLLRRTFFLFFFWNKGKLSWSVFLPFLFLLHILKLFSTLCG